MTLSIVQSATAIIPGNTATFAGSGGSGTYTYAVLSGGAGGSIDSSGNYQAPTNAVMTAVSAQDTIQVTDTTAPTPLVATATIIVGSPLFLLAEIIQTQLGLDNNHIYFWNQKLNEPKDSGLYVVISVSSSRVVGSVNRHASGTNGLNSEQFVNIIDTVEIDILSRSAAARDQKSNVLLALASDYSQQQQLANGFFIAKLPAGGRFVNLSSLDGALIPYRFRISINMQYAYSAVTSAAYFDTLGGLSVVVDGVNPGADELIAAGPANPLPIIISGGGA